MCLVNEKWLWSTWQIDDSSVIKRNFACALWLVYCVRNVVAYGDAREGKWKGNWRMEWVASTLTRPRNVVYPALLPLMPTPRLPAVDWTDSPVNLNGLVRLGERRNLVSARVPSGSARALRDFGDKSEDKFWMKGQIFLWPNLIFITWFYRIRGLTRKQFPRHSRIEYIE